MQEKEREQFKPIFPIITDEQKKDMELQIRNNLFTLKNEQEIELELQEVENLKKIEAEFLQKKQELEAKKIQLEQQKLKKIEMEQQQLSKRLEELINEPKVDEMEERKKVIDVKIKVQEDLKKDLEMQRQIAEKKQEHDMERKIRKKIELEKLLEKKKLINQEMEQLQIFLEAINEEDRSRNMENKELLEKAMARKDLDSKKLSDKEKELIAQAFSVEKDMEGEEKKKEILEEIQQQRQVEANTKQLELKEKVKELNDKKYTYQKQKEELLKKKALFYEKKKKGDLYLQEINGPNQPPMEFLDMNLNVNVDDYREEYTKEQVIEISKYVKDNGEKRIEELKKKAQIQADDVNDYIKNNFQDEDNANDGSYGSKQMDANRINELAREREFYENELKKLNEKKIGNVDDYIIKMIVDEKIETAVLKTIGEIAADFSKIDNQIKDQTQDMFIKVLNQGRKQPINSDQFQRIFNRVAKGEDNQENDAIELKFTGQQEIPNKMGKKQNQDQLNKQLKGKKPGEEQKLEDDLSILRYDPETDCIDEIKDPADLKDLEYRYFKESVAVEVEKFQSNSKFASKKITAMNMSFNKEYLVVGYASGEICIFRTNDENGNVIGRTQSSSKGQIVYLQLPYDSISQILSIDSLGELRVYFNAYNLSEKSDKFNQSVQPMNYIEYYMLSWQHLTQSQSREDKESEALKITYATFHPALTFTYIQPSIMVGSLNGRLMKFNNNKDIYKGKIFRYPIYRLINSEIVSKQDAEFPNEFQNLIQAVDNDQEYLDKKKDLTDKPMIFREFFLQHRSQILFVCFIDNPNSFLTVDTEGYIFYYEYEQTWYHKDTQQMGYLPKNKYQIMCYSWYYEPAKDANGKDLPAVDIHKEWKDQFIEKGKQAYKDYIDRKNYFELLVSEEEKEKGKDVKIFKNKVPQEENEQQTLLTCHIEPNAQLIERLNEQPYISKKVSGMTVDCKSILGNKVFIIEQILPHKICRDWVTVRFVQFDAQNFRMKKIKIQLNQLNTRKLDFSVIESYDPFGSPYLLILAQQGLIIVSLATGQLLHNINDLETTIQSSKALSSKVTLHHGSIFKNLMTIGQQNLFVTNENSGYVFKLKVVDKNTYEDKQQARQSKNQFIQLFNL